MRQILLRLVKLHFAVIFVALCTACSTQPDDTPEPRPRSQAKVDQSQPREHSRQCRDRDACALLSRSAIPGAPEHSQQFRPVLLIESGAMPSGGTRWYSIFENGLVERVAYGGGFGTIVRRDDARRPDIRTYALPADSLTQIRSLMASVGPASKQSSRPPDAGTEALTFRVRASEPSLSIDSWRPHSMADPNLRRLLTKLWDIADDTDRYAKPAWSNHSSEDCHRVLVYQRRWFRVSGFGDQIIVYSNGRTHYTEYQSVPHDHLPVGLKRTDEHPRTWARFIDEHTLMQLSELAQAVARPEFHYPKVTQRTLEQLRPPRAGDTEMVTQKISVLGERSATLRGPAAMPPELARLLAVIDSLRSQTLLSMVDGGASVRSRRLGREPR